MSDNFSKQQGKRDLHIGGSEVSGPSYERAAGPVKLAWPDPPVEHAVACLRRAVSCAALEATVASAEPLREAGAAWGSNFGRAFAEWFVGAARQRLSTEGRAEDVDVTK
jgi:hypothetical protein